MCITKDMRAGVVVFALLFLLFSCQNHSEHPEDPIPPAAVNLRIDLNHEHRRLLEPLSFALFTKPLLYGDLLGHQGLLVVHTLFSESTSSIYTAYDLQCPHDYPYKVSIEVVEDTHRLLIAECPRCHTVYDLAMGVGNPINGIGKSPLLQYQVVQYQNELIVRNYL